MRTLLALSLCALPSLAIAKPGAVVTFPNLPTTPVNVKAGERFKMKIPSSELSKLQPTGASYQGVPLYSAELKYQVDGGAVNSVTIAQPHSTGQGGYDGTTGKRAVSFVVPVGAKQVKYWLLGSNKYTPSAPDSTATKTQYWSNYGQNFTVNVTP